MSLWNNLGLFKSLLCHLLCLYRLHFRKSQILAYTMVRGQDLSRAKRAQCIVLRELHWTQREIADFLECSQKAVFNAIHRHRTTGTHTNRHRTGRRPMTTGRDDRVLRCIAMRRRLVTVPQMRAEWQHHLGRRVSSTLVRRR